MSTKGGQKSGAESNGGKSRAPANAWARPLRATVPPPGMGPPSNNNKAMTASPNSSSMSSPAYFQNRERLLHLSLTLVGQKVVVHQTNGAVVDGVFHTFTPFAHLPAEQKNQYVLKEIHIQQQPTDEPEMKDGTTLIIPASKVVCVHASDIADTLADSSKANGVGLTNFGEAAGSKGAFATDVQISGSASGGRTNDLVAAGNAWTTGGNTNGIGNYRHQGGGGLGGSGMPVATNSRAAALAGKGGGAGNNPQGMGASAAGSAATGGKISGSIGQWDQFKANKELFNVNATFDENLYTTQLDTSQLDAKKMAEAERIAKEIENTTTTNMHMAEERGFKVETDFDEEDRYSGVLTKDGKQRHENVTISKKSGKEKERKPATDTSKSGSSTKAAAPRKIMNYAAAAAKADTGKSKNAPPGFSGNATPAPTTTDNNNTNEGKAAGPPKAIVTPEKEPKEDAKASEKSEPSTEKASTTKDVKETTGTGKKADKVEPSSAKDGGASKAKPTTNVEATGSGTGKKTAESKEKATDKQDEKKETKKSSKLNANAKSFTFNPSAKTFTPGAAAATNPPMQQPPQPAATTDPGMQMYGGGHPMQTPHYMQPAMGQPGMMPIINPQYSNVGYKYPNAYGMDHMQHQAPHMQPQAAGSIPSAPNSGNAPTPTPGSGMSNAGGNDDNQARPQDDASQAVAQAGAQQQPQTSQQPQSEQTVQPQGPPQQQQPMNIPYVPPTYYQGMSMPPRNPGYAQFVTSPQHIAGRPPYGMYPMQGGMPPNMPIRGPNGAAYAYPMAYPPGAHMGYPMMEDAGRGRGGRNSNGGRGGRGGRGRGGRSGRGRSGYNNHNSGKNTQQPYNHHQSQQQQQQPPVVQQQGQSNNGPSNKAE